MDAPKYMYHTELKKRNGWSKKVITHFLPTPCLTKNNPRYRNAAPSHLYLIEKVERIESTSEWQQQALLTNNRKKTASLATSTKRANLLMYVENLTIQVPLLQVDELTKKACDHYNAHKVGRSYERGEQYDWPAATPESDTEFLKRITTNYLRHQLTRYENELEQIAGKAGVGEAYEKLKSKVNQAIVYQYPHLK